MAHDGDGDRSSTADLWQRLRSVDGTAEDKVQSLAQLIAEDDEGIAGFVVTELGRKPLPDEWLEPLLYATEQIQFEDPSERAALKDCLHEHALSLLQSGRVRSESALWAAIRRYASIVPEDEVALLQPFFGERASVATRQVALQAVQTIFHAAAPRDADSLSALRDRICDLAEKTVDPDLLVSPEIASLALNAFLALAAVGDSRAVRLATRLKATGKGWLLSAAFRLWTVC